ncbi:MAG TPA: hypothetical protein VHX65_18680 [Pirellulales bacterium]|jgi:hypothetical protein|nr:hypothetical protein [Pirellulales bacterium]
MALQLAIAVAAIAAASFLNAADHASHDRNPPDAPVAGEVPRLPDWMQTRFTRHLANSAFARMRQSYLARDDEIAAADGQWLMLLDPEKAEELPQAEAIIAELNRRKSNGTFGKKPAKKIPAGFDSWPMAQRISFLIESLDEISDRDHRIALGR